MVELVLVWCLDGTAIYRILQSYAREDYLEVSSSCWRPLENQMLLVKTRRILSNNQGNKQRFFIIVTPTPPPTAQHGSQSKGGIKIVFH